MFEAIIAREFSNNQFKNIFPNKAAEALPFLSTLSSGLESVFLLTKLEKHKSSIESTKIEIAEYKHILQDVNIQTRKDYNEISTVINFITTFYLF